MTKDKQLINDQIDENFVRVVDADGSQLGVMKTFDAINRAKAQKLDLVLVAPNAEPPVCRILDSGKERYNAKKRANAAKKKQTTVEVKEIQLRPVTDKHDLETKLKKAQAFIDKGKKVRFQMRFRGREVSHSEIGMDMMKEIIKTVDNATVEKEPTVNGYNILMILAPESTK